MPDYTYVWHPSIVTDWMKLTVNCHGQAVLREKQSLEAQRAGLTSFTTQLRTV